MADSGIIIIGDQTIGYSERNIHVKWDIPLDLYCERENTTLRHLLFLFPQEMFDLKELNISIILNGIFYVIKKNQFLKEKIFFFIL